jgi:hypothetical protein
MGRRRHPAVGRLSIPARLGQVGALLLVLVAIAGACYALSRQEWRLVDAAQGSVGDISPVALGPGRTVGQTFVAHHAGLAGVEFRLEPANTTPLTATLHLRSEPGSASDLASAVVRFAPNADAGTYRFSFAPLSGSLGQYYYAFLESPAGGISLPLTLGERYLDGAAYEQGEPLNAQSAFSLVYAPGPMAAGFLWGAMNGLGLLGITVLLFVVPGWGLLAWLGPARHLSWPEKLGLAGGIGLAVLPLLLLWSHVVGLHPGPRLAWLPAGLGLAALAWKNRTWRPGQAPQAVRRWAHSPAFWPDAALVLLLGMVFGARLLAVRTLDVPMWGDGYQHSLIVQLLSDHGGLFDSWQPYAVIDRFTYHFGFHSAAAALHWVTGLSAPQAVLWTGQLLNGLAVLALYPLAVRISGSRWAGVVCVLVAGLLSPMPMEYVNWGRYTQLAGQAILPAAAWLTWEAIEEPERRWRVLGLAAIVVAGLALTHYRVVAFYAAFVAALVPFCWRKATWREMLLRLAIVGGGALLLFLPWLLHIFQGAAVAVLGHQLTTMPDQVQASTREYNAMGPLQRYLALGWWIVLPLALGLALWRRQRGPLVVLLWCLFLLLAANPAWLSLPGTGTLSNFTILIAAYIPVGLLAGFSASVVLDRLPRHRLVLVLAAVVTIGAGLWGMRERLGDVDTAGHAYVTRPDVRAAEWIREQAPSDARFLVDSAPAFGGTAVVGTDGGWWLPLLAGRQNTVPPLNYANELRRDSPLRQQVEELAHLVQNSRATDAAVLEALRSAGVTHVYVGQRQGNLNTDAPSTLDPEALAHSDAYTPVYHQDRVWIFQLEPAD